MHLGEDVGRNRHVYPVRAHFSRLRSYPLIVFGIEKGPYAEGNSYRLPIARIRFELR